MLRRIANISCSCIMRASLSIGVSYQMHGCRSLLVCWTSCPTWWLINRVWLLFAYHGEVETWLSQLHESHQGSVWYWPGIDNDLDIVIPSCKHCQEHLPSLPKEPILLKLITCQWRNAIYCKLYDRLLGRQPVTPPTLRNYEMLQWVNPSIILQLPNQGNMHYKSTKPSLKEAGYMELGGKVENTAYVEVILGQ